MTVNFALTSTETTLVVLHRTEDQWQRVKSVDLSAADHKARLKELAAHMKDLDPSGAACKLVVPASFVRYIALSDIPKDADHAAIALEALQGATPYAVEDLVIDRSEAGGGVFIAAVARETLNEAQKFAVAHNFKPVCFTAAAKVGQFIGEPFFGVTQWAYDNLPQAQWPAREGLPIREPLALWQPADNEAEAEVAEPVPAAPSADTAKDVKAPAPAMAKAAPVTPPVSPVAPVSQPQPVAEPVAKAKTEIRAVSVPESVAETQTAAAIVADETKPVAAVAAVPVSEAGTGAEAQTETQAEAQTEAVAAPRPAATRTRRRAASPMGVPIALAAGLAAAALLGWGFIAIKDTQPDVRRHSEIISLKALPTEATDPEKPETSLASRDTASMQAAQLSQQPADTDTGTDIVGPADVPPPARPKQNTLVADARPDRSAQTETEVQAETQAETQSQPQQTEAADSATTAINSQYAQVTFVDGQPPVAPRPRSREIMSDADTSAAVAVIPGRPSMTPPLRNAADPSQPAEPEPAEPESAAASPDETLQTTVEIVTGPPPATPPAAFFSRQSGAAAVAEQAPADTETDQSQEALASEESTEESAEQSTGHPTEPRPMIRPQSVVALAPEPTAEPENPLAQSRPENRPDSIQKKATPLSETEATKPEDIPQTPNVQPARSQTAQTQTAQTRTAQAQIAPATPDPIAVYRRTIKPMPRPRRIQRAAQKALAIPGAGPVDQRGVSSSRNRDSTPSSAKVRVRRSETVMPSSPTPRTVAKTATEKSALKFKKVNLIGVFGSPRSRRALVLLSNGKYQKVKVGDSLDGGRVSSISENSVSYSRNGRSYVLTMPRG